MRTLDQLLRAIVQESARGQSAVQDGSEIHFPLCWQMRTAVVFILAGCGFLLFVVLASGPAPGDPWYIMLIPVVILVPLPVAILLLLPGRVVIESACLTQRFWWRREKRIPWSDFASAIHDRNDGSTIVYGKFESPIKFSPYLVDQSRFDREVKGFSRTDEIPEDI